MDPASHLVFARMVAALRESRHGPRGVIAATVLGGIAPDVDAALMALGWDVYLRWHDAGTHALVGTPLVALLTAGVVRTWAATAPVGSLWFAAWLGALSHVFFDLYSGATVRLFWPIWPAPIATPIVAMADPLAIAAMAAGMLALWVWPRVPRTAAAVAMVLLVLLAGAKLVTRARAVDAYAAAITAGPVPVARAIEAAWGSWSAWHVFDRLPDGRVRAWVADGWHRDARLRFEQPDQRDAAFARASLTQLATAANFVPSHPFAFSTFRTTSEGAVVFWSDARFCWSAGERADPQEGAPHQDVRPAIGALRCELWFGGSLDGAGQPREALVWLGGHLQRRSPQRW